MRRFPVTTLILIAVAIAAVGGWILFAKQEHDRYVAVDRVRHSQSIVRLDYEIERSKGPIAHEAWHMQNVNGVSVLRTPLPIARERSQNSTSRSRITT